MDEIDWLQIIFATDGTVNRSLEYVARRQFPHDETMADEAYNFAFDRLSTNNFAKLSSFQNKAKPSTYLIKVFTNLIRDFHRSKYGRCSPPNWLKAQGPDVVAIHKMLCCDHISKVEILQGYQTNGALEPSIVEATITSILRSIPTCLSRPTPAATKVNIEDQDQLDNSIAADQTVLPPDLELGSDGIISAIWLYISQKQDQLDADQLTKLESLMNKWLPELDLTADEKLLIRKVKVESISIEEAAKQLGLKYHTARRSLERGLGKLRELFEKAGIDEDDLE